MTLITIEFHKLLEKLLTLKELKQFQQAVLQRIFITAEYNDVPLRNNLKLRLSDDLELRLKFLEHQETHHQHTLEILERRIENSISRVSQSPYQIMTSCTNI